MNAVLHSVSFRHRDPYFATLIMTGGPQRLELVAAASRRKLTVGPFPLGAFPCASRAEFFGSLLEKDGQLSMAAGFGSCPLIHAKILNLFKVVYLRFSLFGGEARAWHPNMGR